MGNMGLSKFGFRSRLLQALASRSVGGPTIAPEVTALLAELGLRDLEAEVDMISALSMVMQTNGLASKSDLVGYMKADCGGVTSDSLKNMGLSKFGFRSRLLKALASRSVGGPTIAPEVTALL